MGPRIFWAGMHKGKVWGYMSHNWFPRKTVHIFWGIRGGNIYFQPIYDNAAFNKTKKKKQDKYLRILDAGFEDLVKNELGQYMVHQKLKFNK